MAVILKIPTWATFSRIPAETPESGLAAINYALQLSLSVGDLNPAWADLQDISLGGGSFTRGLELTDIANSSPIENTAFLTIQQIQLVVAVGGDVSGLQVFFELDDLDDEVPESFPNRTYMSNDEDPVEVVHTWNTWGTNGESHAAIKIGDKWYKSNSDGNNLGQPLDANKWAFSALTIKTVNEYILIRDSYT